MGYLQKILSKIDDAEVRSYCGRGMRHDCLGVTIAGSNPMSKVLQQLLQDVNDENRDQLMEAVDDIRQDNMGMETIVYFPDVDFESEDEEVYDDPMDDQDQDTPSNGPTWEPQ